jgi:hypothetical protein
VLHFESNSACTSIGRLISFLNGVVNTLSAKGAAGSEEPHQSRTIEEEPLCFLWHRFHYILVVSQSGRNRAGQLSNTQQHAWLQVSPFFKVYVETFTMSARSGTYTFACRLLAAVFDPSLTMLLHARFDHQARVNTSLVL